MTRGCGIMPRMRLSFSIALIAALLAGASGATLSATTAETRGPETYPGEAPFRDLYRELVETNTTLSAGSCTLAAERLAARLRAAGFAEADLELFAAPDHPKEGGLVARYPGRDPALRPILLLAHLDVVEARREDWTRDPFTMIEENGAFYGRGVVDDKAEAAIWVDLFIRFRQEKFHPRRALKLALTCGEETAGAFNGAEWLVANRRALIDAAFALNEGAFGELGPDGQPVALEIEAGEKTAQNYRLEVTNPGGHSSRPVKDNAIYRLAAALTRIAAYEFPPQFTDVNRAYLAGMARIERARGEAALAEAMETLGRDPANAAALRLVAGHDPTWNATLRTTCVATLLDAGHATNALPQRARANINCRIFPGVSAETIRQVLVEQVADAQVTVTTLERRGPSSDPPPLTREVLGPVETLAKEFWPGVPVVPILQPGATDGQFLNAAGIPTYGIEPLFVGADLGNMHGRNEYVAVRSLLEGREFLHRLVRIYADER
jgi:acetylornithine deacetylase/succinyl-diaminopimelate desuccinylase-like protein